MTERRADNHPQQCRAETLYLGVDGGGTRTTAVLWCLPVATANRCEVDRPQFPTTSADPGDIGLELGRGVAGCSNFVAAGGEALKQLELAVDRAFGNANRAPDRVTSACLALAGSNRPSVHTAVQAWAHSRNLATQLAIVSDAAPLLMARTGPEMTCGSNSHETEHNDVTHSHDLPVVALISGTGSIAWGRRTNGCEARAGGWGPLLGDEGSGYAIAWMGLRAILRAHDEGIAFPAFASDLLNSIGVAELLELPAQLANRSRDEIASWATVICRAAPSDCVACQLLDQAAAELARLVRCVAQKLSLPSNGFQLNLSGGMLMHSAFLQTQLLSHLDSLRYRPALVRLITDVAIEAARLAIRLAANNDSIEPAVGDAATHTNNGRLG